MRSIVDETTSAFQVTPSVYIHDRGLQTLNLVLKGAIFFYIVVWSIAMDKQYLDCYDATGTSKLHAKRLHAASDSQCEAANMPRTAGHESSGFYFQTDKWCDQQAEGVADDEESWECDKRGSGEIELSYDLVGAELPSGFNTLTFRTKYGVTPSYVGSRLATYDSEGIMLYFGDLLLSRPYIQATDVMGDDTLGGNHYEIEYTLEDLDGNVVNTCTDVGTASYDWRVRNHNY